MSALKPVKWQMFEKVLLHYGCEFVHQNGSHRVYKKPDLIRPIIVPAHNFPIPIFVIKNNLRLLGISNKEYQEVLRKVKLKKTSRELTSKRGAVIISIAKLTN